MRRWCLTIPLLALAASASANAAMGLGLEMFSMATWTIYVAVTVAFEAWFIGRFFKKSWIVGVCLSFVANFITGFGCISICAVGLHQPFVGSRLNPNPFWNAVALFTVFGLISAAIESIVWWMSINRSRESDPGSNPYEGLAKTYDFQKALANSILYRSLLAHLAGVPLGLAILLIPPRPYAGLEAFTNMNRRWERESFLRREIPLMLDERGSFPCVKSLPALLPFLPEPERPELDEWAAFYKVHYGRFATGEDRSEPAAELNPDLCGFKLPKEGEEGVEGKIWVMRTRGDEWASGLVLDRQSGEVSRTSDPKALGYEQK